DSCWSFDLVLIQKLQFLDLFYRSLGVVERDLAVTLEHACFNADSKEVLLTRTHVERVTFLVIRHANDVFARLNFDSEISAVIHASEFSFIDEHRWFEGAAHDLLWPVNENGCIFCVRCTRRWLRRDRNES